MTTSDGPGADVGVLVVAGGAGVRMGAGPPKAFRALAGEPLVVHALRRVDQVPSLAAVVVAAPAGTESRLRELAGDLRASAPPARDQIPRDPDPGGRVPGGLPTGDQVPGDPTPGAAAADLAAPVTVVTGGVERRDSVAAALAALPPGPEIVLVHDAARPLTPPSVMAAVADAVRGGRRAVIPVLPVVDTITEVDGSGLVAGSPDRTRLRAVQTPQGFRRSVLAGAHAAADSGPVTDDAGLVARHGIPVHTVPGSPFALKITTSHDLAVVEALLPLAPV